MNIFIKKLNTNAEIPTYKTKGASGADLYACLEEDITINPSKNRNIRRNSEWLRNTGKTSKWFSFKIWNNCFKFTWYDRQRLSGRVISNIDKSWKRAIYNKK